MYFKLVNGDFLISFSPFLTRCLWERFQLCQKKIPICYNTRQVFLMMFDGNVLTRNRRMMLVSNKKEINVLSLYHEVRHGPWSFGFLRTAVGFQINKTPTTPTLAFCFFLFFVLHVNAWFLRAGLPPLTWGPQSPKLHVDFGLDAWRLAAKILLGESAYLL